MRWILLVSLIFFGGIGPFLGFGGENAAERLKNPADLTEQAPAEFKVKFRTTQGDFIAKITRDWSPVGVDRFYNLVKAGYFKDIAFYRVLPGFMAQFGFHGEPEINKSWAKATIKDDPAGKSNTPGRLTFAKRGSRHSRTTQFFINTTDNSYLDGMGFTPLGEVEGEGLAVVKKLYSGYGEGAPRGNGPNQGRLEKEGNAYLKEHFPKLDYILEVSLVEG